MLPTNLKFDKMSRKQDDGEKKYRLMRLPVAARKSKNLCQAFKFFPVHFQYRVMTNSQLKENANFLISKYSNTKIVNGQNCVL